MIESNCNVLILCVRLNWFILLVLKSTVLPFTLLFLSIGGSGRAIFHRLAFAVRLINRCVFKLEFQEYSNNYVCQNASQSRISRIEVMHSHIPKRKTYQEDLLNPANRYYSFGKVTTAIRNHTNTEQHHKEYSNRRESLQCEFYLKGTSEADK